MESWSTRSRRRKPPESIYTPLDEVDCTAWADRIIDLINQQEVAAYMAFPVVRPYTFQRVILPFGTERGFVCDKKQHDRLQPLHIISTGSRKPLPVLEEVPCIVHPARRVRSFTGR